jgi:hypothetical protein
LPKVFILLIKKSKNLDFRLEIQIDCDWTAGTKNDYFKFLKKLKAISQKKSLLHEAHQVKIKVLGIPPVKKFT